MYDEVKGEQGLAALALGNFADKYEIEGDRHLEVGVEGWDRKKNVWDPWDMVMWRMWMCDMVMWRMIGGVKRGRVSALN
jgi:hypothetical protein